MKLKVKTSWGIKVDMQQGWITNGHNGTRFVKAPLFTLSMSPKSVEELFLGLIY